LSHNTDDVKCLINVSYQFTGMPNFAGHSLQTDAKFELESYALLIQSGCANELQVNTVVYHSQDPDNETLLVISKVIFLFMRPPIPENSVRLKIVRLTNQGYRYPEFRLTRLYCTCTCWYKITILVHIRI